MRKLLHSLRSDESLMLAYQQGDSSAFEVLYGRHKDALFRFLYQHCPQTAVVEELAQEAWMSIIKAAERYQVSAKFRTYLYQVAHNKLLDHWRRDKNQRNNLDIDELELSAANTSLDMEADENLKVIGAAILQLPADQRDAFLLREEGFTHEQIGHIVGAGKETVKSRLRYAGNQLRELLKGDEDDGTSSYSPATEVRL